MRRYELIAKNKQRFNSLGTCAECGEDTFVFHTHELCQVAPKNELCTIEGCSIVYCRNTKCIGRHMSSSEEIKFYQ